MKKQILLSVLVLLSMMASAQVKRTINVPVAGTLSTLISEGEKYQIEELTLTGELNGTDIRFIRNMSGIDYYEYYDDEDPYGDVSTPGILKKLDISGAIIVSGGSAYYARRVRSYHGEVYYTVYNSISDYMFYRCGLSSIKFSNNVTNIGEMAFYACSALTSVTIPNSVSSIGDYAFYQCSGLTTITSEILNPFEIGKNVFYNNNKNIYAIATLIVPPGKKTAYQNTAGWNKFENIVEKEGIGYKFEADGIYYKIDENNTVSVTYGSTRCSGNIVIPSQVTYNGKKYTVTGIGDDAFSYYGPTSISIPNSISYISPYAFDDCYSLSAVYITDLEAWCNIYFSSLGVSNPLGYAHHLYLNGTEIKDLVIPDGITSIKNLTFAGCSGLTSITIPDNVTSIGYSAFQNCTGVTTITSEITNPFAIYDDVFACSDKDIYATAKLIVPAGKKSAYQSTAGWSKFQNIVEADEFEAGNIRYKIGENNTVSVVARNEKYSGNVVIPSQVAFNGYNYTVFSIATSAFEGCTDLTSVSIPSSVTMIGGAAFYYCTGLTTVDIPNGVKIIGEGAFSKCGGLTSVTIPGSVTSIGKNAFFQCYALTQITSGIENPFTIDDGVFPTSVYNNASLQVPSGRKSAYQNTAGWKRFQNIVEAGGDVKEFEADGVYYKVGGNNTVSVMSGNVQYSGDITIPMQVKYNGTTYTVTGIEPSAFSGCTGLTSITIPNSVTAIGGYAFSGCTGLTSANIPNNVTSLEGVFEGCTSLAYIAIPNSIMTIGDYAFSGCTSLTFITIPNSVTTIGQSAFASCSGLTDISIGNSVTNIGNYAFNGCSSLTSVDIPDNVTTIGSYAFRDCSSLTSATISNGVKTIEYRTFSGCSSLTSVRMPDGLTSIGGYAFSECKSLPTITIPNSVTSIGQRAFYSCSGLSTIVSEITYPFAIDENVFESTQRNLYTDAVLIVPVGLRDVYLATNGWNKFQKIVESDSGDVEFTQDGISYIVMSPYMLEVTGVEPGITDVSIPESVEHNGTSYIVISIGAGAFHTNKSIVSVTIPYGVGSIGKDAFGACSNLSYITIPSSVTEIGPAAFYGCTSLSTVDIPLGLRRIGSSMFWGCTALSSVTIPESVTCIDEEAFLECTSLTSVTIPNSVMEIGNSAFRKCTSLTSVISEIDAPFAINDNVFEDIALEATLFVPIGTTDFYRATDGWKNFMFIEEWDPTAIDTPTDGRRHDVKAVYSIRGEKLEQPSKGINIIKMQDGTVKKVFVK